MLVTAPSTNPGTGISRIVHEHGTDPRHHGSFLPTNLRQLARRGVSCGVRAGSRLKRSDRALSDKLEMYE